MVICAEAGLSLDATLNRIARELEPTWPELAEEFGITAAELTFLPDRRQAFDNLNAPNQHGVDPRRRGTRCCRPPSYAARAVAARAGRGISATRG